MLWTIKAEEDFVAGDFVEFFSDAEGKRGCKKALVPDSVVAMTARDIARGELLTFDTTGDTSDLVKLKDAT